MGRYVKQSEWASSSSDYRLLYLMQQFLLWTITSEVERTLENFYLWLKDKTFEEQHAKNIQPK